MVLKNEGLATARRWKSGWYLTSPRLVLNKAQGGGTVRSPCFQVAPPPDFLGRAFLLFKPALYISCEGNNMEKGYAVSLSTFGTKGVIH